MLADHVFSWNQAKDPCSDVAESPFHGGNRSSNLRGDAMTPTERIERRNRRFSERLKIERLLPTSTRPSTPAKETRAYLVAVIQVRSRPNMETGCVEWTGATSGAGYGRIKYKKKLYSPHRVVLENKLRRAMRPGEDACHHCDNPRCVNPAHLFAGSRYDNMRDAVLKGRLRPAPKSREGIARIIESNRRRAKQASRPAGDAESFRQLGAPARNANETMSTPAPTRGAMKTEEKDA